MIRNSRLLPLMVTLLACGCRQQVSAELAGSTLTGVADASIGITGVELRRSGGDTVSLPLDSDADGEIHLTSLVDGETLPLASEEKDFTGDYSGVRVTFAGTGTVEDDDGGQHDLQLSSQAGFSAASFKLNNDDQLDLVLEVSLPFSVTPPSAGGDAYQFQPVVRVARRDDMGSLGGSLKTSLVTGCEEGREPGVGVAVYLYAGKDHALVDFVSSSAVRPLASAPAEEDNGAWSYQFNFLPSGDYTVAFTCQADRERPQTDDDITFSLPANVSVSADDDSTHDFGS